MAYLSFMHRNKTDNRLFPVSLFTSFLGHMQWPKILTKDARSRGNQSHLPCIKLRFRHFGVRTCICSMLYIVNTDYSYKDAGTDFRQARSIVNSKASKMITG